MPAVSVPIGDEGAAWFARQARMLQSGRFDLDGSLGHFMEGCRSAPAAAFEQFKTLMAVVRDESRWPLLIHCSAGKDRTGIAAALILEAIGVGGADIMQDYLLTNRVARSKRQAEILVREQKSRAVPRTGTRIGATRVPSAEAHFPFFGFLPEMLEAFHAGVDERDGGMDGDLREPGFDEAAREQLTYRPTEPGG
jgi:protein-tyrosine phosphatase